MKRLLFILAVMFCSVQLFAQQWVRVNTVGYLPNDVKVAVFISKEPVKAASFKVCDAVTGEVVLVAHTKAVSGEKWKMGSAYR